MDTISSKDKQSVLLKDMKPQLVQIRKQIGIIRSIFIYYLKPFNGFRLKTFYSNLIKSGDLCFDIGAHLGNRSNTWLKMGAKVIAVEPQPLCIDYLNKRFNSNKNFKLIPMAVGEKTGTGIFRISSLYPTISTISHNWQFSKSKSPENLKYWDDQINVDIITLDSLIDKYGLPDFCKIDVEDFELEVLNGLSRPIPSLSFEFLPAGIDKAILCLKRIRKLGEYEFNISFKEYLKFEYKKWLNFDQIIVVIKNHKKEISGDIYARRINN